jgi:Ser/Thr protein kinase RdoA (MazF antagonist)
MGDVERLTKVAEGREAEMFAWDHGKVLRLLRPGFDPASLENEARALRVAYACGIPVPEPGERLSVDGRAGIVLERIAGVDLLTEVGRAPWTVVRAARMCGAVHARMHKCQVVDDGLPTLRSRLERQLASPLVPPELREAAKKQLEGLPDGDMLCHYDLHPANVMRGPRGPVVIDWPNATRGTPEADVARTQLLLDTGEPPNPTAFMQVLIGIGRGLFLWQYLGAYMRVRPLDKREVQRWALPIAIARLAEDIEEERERLMRRIDALRRTS